MQRHGQQHQADVIEEKAPVARNGADDEANQRHKTQNTHRFFAALRSGGKTVRAPQAQHKGDADDHHNVTDHFQRIERDGLQQARRCRVHAAPKRKIQRHDHDGDGVGDRRHRDRQRHIALGTVREDVGDIARRAAGHQDHAQCNAGTHVQQQRQAIGNRRQHDKLRRNAHGHGPGHARHALEVFDARIQRNAKHQKSQHTVEQRQGCGVEVQPYFVHR